MTKGKRDGQTMIYYQVNHDRNHWNIILTERYASAAGMLLTF
jgi:hypothetical protein